MLRLLGVAAVLLAAAGAAGWVWIRTAPDDPARWHVDPLTVQRPETPNSHLLAPAGAARARTDGEAPVWDATPERLMRAFDAMALSQPRTSRLAGDPSGTGPVTYVQRSAFWGFPDYISVRALPAEGGATLATHSRSRYGHSDLGVNEARVSAWLDAIAL